MGVFDSPPDRPGLIRVEGQEITLRFDRTGPTSGRVSWNIPPPADGCTATTQAYCGIVVTIDTQPASINWAPVDGESYEADPTADPDLHAGDRLGSALVIGAFYEGEKKGTGEDLTTAFDITGLESNTAYYVSGYAVDCTLRYHREGTFAYSQNFGGEGTENTSGSQTAVTNTNISLTDGTGLNSNSTYRFESFIDGIEVNFNVSGANAQTYEQLINTLNRKFQIATKAPQSSVPPNANVYWFKEDNSLSQWDGYQETSIPVIVEAEDPTMLEDGELWYNPNTDVLRRWNGSPGMWDVVDEIIKYNKDLTDSSVLTAFDYWFDPGTASPPTNPAAYYWCTNKWCQLTLFNQTNDPALSSLEPNCGTFWFDEVNNTLNQWDEVEDPWVPANAIYWDKDPRILDVGSPSTDGVFWYDDANKLLYIREQISSPLSASWKLVGGGGSPIVLGSPVETVTISETEPTSPSEGDYWVRESTQQVFLRTGSPNAWTEQDAIFYFEDPADVESCELWWKTDTDELFAWDVVNNIWKEVETFILSETDPTTAPTRTKNDAWYNPSTGTLSRWDGSQWVEVSFVEFTRDPTMPLSTDVWFNTDTSIWYKRDGSPETWVSVDLIESTVDPSMAAIPTGSFWYDTTNSQLFRWNGASWMSILFTTSSPKPIKDDLWYDTSTGTLFRWTGTMWVETTGVATVGVNIQGNLIFSSTTTGSLSHITISELDSTVLTSLTGYSHLNDPLCGSDGLQGVPSYAQIGVGTDGSTDERRDLLHAIRLQLGYPVIEVELTKEQIDKSVQVAIEELRRNSASGYRRGFMKLQIKPGIQRYVLSNKTPGIVQPDGSETGYDHITEIMGIHRTVSAFMTSAHGSGIFGQVVLQHLYNMGTFDLLSYHLVSSYIEDLEILFASRLVYSWNESNRTLWLHQVFSHSETAIMDVAVERTEQDLLTDRYTKRWIERYALAHSRYQLAEIRGKFGTYPGAGGGVTLNATDLGQRALEDMERLQAEIDDFVVNSVEEFGSTTSVIIG